MTSVQSGDGCHDSASPGAKSKSGPFVTSVSKINCWTFAVSVLKAPRGSSVSGADSIARTSRLDAGATAHAETTHERRSAATALAILDR